MLTTLMRVTSRRVWFVPHFSVWGTPEWSNVDYLVVEDVESVKSVLFGSVAVDESAQSVKFSDLVDHRGNHLPTVINCPRVIIRSRSAEAAFVVGDETAEGFKIAHSSEAPGPVTVDLLVVEVGD